MGQLAQDCDVMLTVSTSYTGHYKDTCVGVIIPKAGLLFNTPLGSWYSCVYVMTFQVCLLSLVVEIIESKPKIVDIYE